MSDDIKDFLKDIFGIVEANNFEYSALWERWNKRVEWESCLEGRGIRIGEIAEMPVFLSLRIAIINGKKILFYEPTSVVVDWRMVREWLSENLTIEAYAHRTDAMNFHTIVFSIEEQK